MTIPQDYILSIQSWEILLRHLVSSAKCLNPSVKSTWRGLGRGFLFLCAYRHGRGRLYCLKLINPLIYLEPQGSFSDVVLRFDFPGPGGWIIAQRTAPPLMGT
jgi:hypothetical protein